MVSTELSRAVKPVKQPVDVRRTESSQTADRVLQLLSYLASVNDPIGVTAAAAVLNISAAATHRLLQSLVAQGFAEQDSSRRYRLGPGVVSLAQRFLGSSDIRARYRPLLERAQQITEESACLIAPAGLQRVCVDYVLSSHSIAYVPTVGQTLPIATGAVGRALLAGLAPADREAFVMQLFNAGPERERWEADLNHGKETGYFVGFSELIPEMNGLAFPLKDSHNRTVAVLSITGPAYRLTSERIAEIAPPVSHAIDSFAAM